MIKLKELVKHQCECGNSCCSVNESADDARVSQKKLQQLMKNESSLRLSMYELTQVMSKDKKNLKLANEIIGAYKNSVTKFMRTAVKSVKKVK